jgi:glycine/D-amino acid oxidase-like deaminating enzyme
LIIFDAMQTDILIIGQGICGSFLAWWLEQAGVPFIVIDEQLPFTASRAAAGLINPVTGRRIVKTWMIDELLPFARQAYGQMGAAFGVSFLGPAMVTDFFPTVQMRLAFLERHGQDRQYLQLPEEEHSWDAFFRYELGYGIIGPCYLVNMVGLLEACRNRMKASGVLLEERFDREALMVDGSDRPEETNHMEGIGLSRGTTIRYKDIEARRIIFCDGIGSCDSPYFSRLPFAPNKGEALIVEIPDLPGAQNIGAGGPTLSDANAVFKKGISLLPWKENLYWAGSSFEWSFPHDAPTEAFRQRTQAILQDWLKAPFKIVDHIASVRPATLERRPFVGFHPLYPTVGILNGMGTKGCSLAPYFAHQLVQHITQGSPILADADVRRFVKILSR